MSRRAIIGCVLSSGGKTVSLTNLCTNGNFASTSGWTNSGMASFTVSGNIASALANSQYDAVYRADVPVTNTHKYYICSTYNMPAGYASSNANMYLTDGTSLVTAANPLAANNGTFAFISNIGTATHTSSSGRLYCLNDNKTSPWSTLQNKYISIIDLTAAFGAGNEPSQAQMDSLMPQFANNWLNGTQNATYFW